MAVIHFCLFFYGFWHIMEQRALLAWSVRSAAQQEAVAQHGPKLRDGTGAICGLDPIVATFAVQKGRFHCVPTSQGAQAHFHTSSSSQAADGDTDSLCSLLSGLLNMKRSGLEELRKQRRSEAGIGCLEVCHSALVTGGVMGMLGMFLFHQWSGPLSKKPD